MRAPQLLTSKEAAEILAVPEGTLRYWRKSGVGPCWIKLEGSVRYDLADVLRYIERGRRTPSVRANMEENDVSLRGKTWHYDFSIAGERYRGSTKESILSRARVFEALLMSEARERGTFSVPRRPALSEFANRFLTWVERSDLEPGSKRYYRYGWEIIKDTRLSKMQLNKITTDETNELRLGRSAANANNALRTLRRMLGKAAEWGLIRNSPRIKLVKEYGRSTLIDQAMEIKLLAVAKQPLRDVLLILLDTGMRPGELFRTRWENVSWTERKIFVPFGKTRNSRRFVPMSQRVSDALLHRAAGKTEGWAFPSSRSKTGHLVTVEKQFLIARKKAGISSSVVLYSARHSFATQTLAATGNLAAVMRRSDTQILGQR